MSSLTPPTDLCLELTCPACWYKFAPEAMKWVAAHPDLLGDPKRGDNVPIRFTPTRFDASGNAIDRNGAKCHAIACPRCHAVAPRAMVETPPIFLSIAGSPSCGKTYFLTSMAWQMRQSLPANFKVAIMDADSSCNRTLNDYEEQQFFNADRNTPVRLCKTEEQGDLYDAVNMDNQTVLHPQPFLFSVRPMQGHPGEQDSARISRLLCLYDNAGESFLPGRDSVNQPVTRHLGEASALFFCFDPTQDPRMRSALRGKTNDFQVVEETVTSRQEIVFQEMAERFKRLSGITQTQKTDRPVVIVVTKFDAWKPLYIDNEEMPLAETLGSPIQSRPDGSQSVLDRDLLNDVSNRTREVMFRYSPELVSAAEALSHRVSYVPVSATGRSPSKDLQSGILGIRPSEIDPVWCDVPLISALAQHGSSPHPSGLIPSTGGETF